MTDKPTTFHSLDSTIWGFFKDCKYYAFAKQSFMNFIKIYFILFSVIVKKESV